MSSTGFAIVAEGLTKRFGTAVALDGFDLSVPTGTVRGMLGPNGAGKTTAVRILATLLRASAGRAVVAGFDVGRQAARGRSRIGRAGAGGGGGARPGVGGGARPARGEEPLAGHQPRVVGARPPRGGGRAARQ